MPLGYQPQDTHLGKSDLLEWNAAKNPITGSLPEGKLTRPQLGPVMGQGR